MHQVGDQPRLYNDARSTNHQDCTACTGLHHLHNVHRLKSAKTCAFINKHVLFRKSYAVEQPGNICVGFYNFIIKYLYIRRN